MFSGPVNRGPLDAPRPPLESANLSLQAGGRRFAPGWLHYQKSLVSGDYLNQPKAPFEAVRAIGHQNWASNAGSVWHPRAIVAISGPGPPNVLGAHSLDYAYLVWLTRLVTPLARTIAIVARRGDTAAAVTAA
jgi:hypothetical protein